MRIFVSLELWLLVIGAGQEEIPLGPRPGDVYKEYVLHNVGDRAWRVTSPEARHPGARKYLPNPIWRLQIDDLQDAVRAEVMLDRWGGHLGTIDPKIRLNGRDWLPLKPPLKTRGLKLSEDYYFQDNPVIPVPCDHLKAGENVVEATCSHQKPGGWGQWGLYALLLRVYYRPDSKLFSRGRIVAPSSGEIIGENPLIRIMTDGDPVDRVDVFAYYDGYDENGDGLFQDWHGGWFKPYRDEPPIWQGHVGTVGQAPFELIWDTRWVPDQPPGQIRLVARIRHPAGVWFVTEEVTGLTLRRPQERVCLYRTFELPPEFGVRSGQRRSCIIELPADYNPADVVECSLHYRSWHGWDGHHAPYRLNDFERAHQGKNHHYHYHVHLIPPGVLRPGQNRFEIYSSTEHHMLEILWPGPALVVRTKR